MTDETDTERQLLEYRAIFDNAAVGIVYTCKRIFGRCNTRGAALLGYTPSEMEGMPASTIYPSAESYATMGQRAGPLLAAGESFDADWQYQRKDGTLLWCHVYARAVDPERTDRGTVWILEDVTEARAIAEAHRIASAEMQAIMDNASVAILFTRDRKIVRHNPKFGEMFAYPAGSAIGVFGRELYRNDEDYAAIGQLAFPLLSQGKPFQHETFMRSADGSELWVNLIAYLIDPATPSRGTIWLLEDRSDFKAAADALSENLAQLKETNRKLEEAQNQLLQSEKLASIGLLAAGVAHEINNPVGFVSSNLGTLEKYTTQLLKLIDAYQAALHAVPLPEPVSAQLNATLKATDIEFLREDAIALLHESKDGIQRVRQIVQNLKDFSHVDAGEWKPIDLNACFESTLNVMWNEIKYKTTLERELGALPEVLCNAPQINQVMLNLLVNAGQAIETRGTIHIRTGYQDEQAWFEVEDSGCGMSEQVQKRIFEPFFTTKPVGKGTGLGLSVSYGIVGKHHGRIEVDSAPGRGTRFRVWLPIGGPAGQPGGQPTSQ